MSTQLVSRQSPPTRVKPLSDALPQIEPARIACVNHLSEEHYDTWLDFFYSNPELESPYFHPEFTKCVNRVRNDVQTLVLLDSQNNACGFLPMQRISKSIAQPIGGKMNDFAGVIAKERIHVRPEWILRNADLKRFDFHALVTDDTNFDPFVFEELPSYYIDLKDTWQNYLSFVNKKSSTIKRLPQKIRALNRDIGDVSFEFESTDASVLEELIELKREKFNRTNTFDILSVDWAANLLRTIHKTDAHGFRGILSVLRAGKQLVAAHIGMITGNVLHYWFPVYSPEFAKYSPGLQLMLENCRAAHRKGIKKIDMSYGESDFKDKFCNSQSTVKYGSLNLNPIAIYAAKQKYFLRQSLKKIPMKSTAKRILRKFFPGYGKWHFK